MKIFRKLTRIVSYLFYLFVILVVFDVLILHNILGYGYPRHYAQEHIQRYPAPYVAFTATPNVLDHNQFGFRGKPLQEAGKSALKIAFFGGSTGYYGWPTIAMVVEQELEKLLGEEVFVANYSVVSSNHRQHLHGIIEFLPQYDPDLIIFYGGFNESIQSANSDPRPGYPYNFFYRSETKPLYKLLIENSGIIGEIDRRIGFLTGLNKLKEQEQPFSRDWNMRTADKYYETLMLANKVASSIESGRFGHTKFIAFYQPYRILKKYEAINEEMKRRVENIPYAFDVSNVYDTLGDTIYRDDVHVNQQAKEVMGKKIAKIIEREVVGVLR